MYNNTLFYDYKFYEHFTISYIFFGLLSIVLSPLVLTIIRGALEDRLTPTQDKILSISTIASSIYIANVILRRASFLGDYVSRG